MYRYIKGSEGSRETVAVPLDGQEGLSIECLVDVDLLLCGTKFHKRSDGDYEELRPEQILSILGFVKEEREKIIASANPKSYQSWIESGIDMFDEYFRVGDIVDEDLIDYYLDLLPPAYFDSKMLQVGEPYSCQYDELSNDWRNTYTTFAKYDDGWKYVGECFYKRRKNVEDRIDRFEKVAHRIREVV